jgi:hypothetical protein
MVRTFGLSSAYLLDVIGGHITEVREGLTNPVLDRKCQAEDWTIAFQMVDQRAPSQVLPAEGMNEEKRRALRISGSDRNGSWRSV